MIRLPFVRRKHDVRPEEEKAFREWFATETDGSFAKSFFVIPNHEVLEAVYVLLLRAASAGHEVGDEAEDAYAVRLHDRLRRKFGGTASSVAYRVALCAAVNDMREKHRDASVRRVAETKKATNQ